MQTEAKDLTLNNSFKLRSKALNYYEFNSNEQLNSFFKNSLDYEDLSIVGEGPIQFSQVFFMAQSYGPPMRAYQKLQTAISPLRLVLGVIGIT